MRKSFKIGKSRGVILPPSWCSYFGDRVKSVTILEDGILLIAPTGLEEKAQAMIDQYQQNKGGIQDG